MRELFQLIEAGTKLLIYGLALAGIAGLVITTIQTILTVFLLKGRDAAAGKGDWSLTGHGSTTDKIYATTWAAGSGLIDRLPPHPKVSILKPICGLEDGLEQNLESFASLRGVAYEVIFSVAEPDDPALEVLDRVRRRFPSAPFHLVIGGALTSAIANPKVERLIAASRKASGDIFFISDSNVRVSADDIARTVRHLDDPRVGCVSNPFVGDGGVTFGALIESLYLLTFVVPGAALAHWFGVPCVVGKSMAMRRELCEKIGGFESFIHRLAEDQAIGIAIKQAGYRVVLSPVVVRNMIGRRTIGAALSRQIRWGKLRYSFSRACYTAEFMVNPLPLILAACALSGLAPQLRPLLTVLLPAGLLLRLLQAVFLAWAAGARLTWRRLLLVPVQDVLQSIAQLVPYWSKEVTWRGHRRRLGHGTQIVAPPQYDTPAAA
jgi:ceramide glucosyltransferase